MSPEPIVIGRVGASVTHLADPTDSPTTTPGVAPDGSPTPATDSSVPSKIPYGSPVPAGIDIAAIRKDLLSTGVSAPSDQVAALKDVVAYGHSRGHDFKFVVLTDKQAKFTYYRDVAIELQSSTGGTVIVLGPNAVGSQGPDFSRVDQEEAAQNNLTLSNPPQAARHMVDDLLTPSTNWTAITLMLMFVVIVGAVVGRLMQRRRADRNADAGDSATTSEPVVDGESEESSGGAGTDAEKSSADAS
ncbi:hypothetical protein HH308_03945 [Gordonia sp. TBRC 11910]|uniref:Uncharacterized protein n=1 Tax=Gordonia asplenii TaxID=2725283 RepID=A0A848KMR0_9ACTN|nr:DUF6676 family protein [Gordonia asplenii]NMO00364.1 hypothetical protein [Gordonia asplenii]